MANVTMSANHRQIFVVDLDGSFFDAEVAMEGNGICRDLVSTIQQEEHNYLQNVSEILLFLLMPDEDFAASPMRVLLREIVANSLLKPTLDLVSDPDFINQTIVWMCGAGAVGGAAGQDSDAGDDPKIKPDIFISSVRCSESLEELSAIRDMVADEIAYLRSNDSKSDSELKQQLNSLLYVKKVIHNRITVIQSGHQGEDLMTVPGEGKL